MTPTTATPATEADPIRAAADRRSTELRALFAETRELRDQIDRALEAKDYAAYNGHIRRLRAIFREHPTAWRLTGDLARKTSLLLAEVVTDDPHAKESMLAGVEQLRADLGYARSPQLERVLIDQVAIAWVNAEVASHCFAMLAYKGGKEPEHAAFWEKRVESAERRLQRAVESLARTRKLVRSTKLVQINYAHQQVVQNAVGGAGAAAGAAEPPRIAAVSSATPAPSASTSMAGDRTPEAAETVVVAAGEPAVGNADVQRAERAPEPEGGFDREGSDRDGSDEEGLGDEDVDDGFDDWTDDFFADEDPLDEPVGAAAPSRPVRQWISTLPSQLFRTAPDEALPSASPVARLEPDMVEPSGGVVKYMEYAEDVSLVGGFLAEMDRRAAGSEPSEEKGAP